MIIFSHLNIVTMHYLTHKHEGNINRQLSVTIIAVKCIELSGKVLTDYFLSKEIMAVDFTFGNRLVRARFPLLSVSVQRTFVVYRRHGPTGRRLLRRQLDR